MNNKITEKTFIGRLALFIVERFNLPINIITIATFFSAHYYFYLKIGDKLTTANLSLLKLSLLFFGVLLFFLKLRFYDDLKDYNFDLDIHPERPLPRGTVKKNDLYKAIIFCLIAEILIFSFFELKSFFITIIAVIYSLLMYKEFFVSKLLRKHLVWYALTHTIIVSFISLIIFSTLTAKYFWELPVSVYIFSFGSWFMFNIFEFSRKIFATTEEKRGIDSYSKIFGRYGAVLLVIIMASLSYFMLSLTPLSQLILFKKIFPASALILLIIGMCYAYFNNKISAKIFRFISSLYILFYYLAIIFIITKTI